MRRRYQRAIEEDSSNTLLLMAAGAIAGAAAGLYLGRRYGSLDAFMGDMRGRMDDLRDLWYEDDLLDDDDDRETVRLGADDEFEDVEEDYLETDDADDEADDEADAEAADELEEFDEELAAVVRDNGSASATPSEAAARRLELAVLDALREEPVLGARPIEIAVVGDGVVELTGTVNAIDEVSRSAAFVRRVPGVSMVLNRLEVRSGGSMETASVRREVSDIPDDRSAPPA